MIIRPGTYDSEIVKEMPRAYGGLDYLDKKVMDIGGCFGAFAIFAVKQGASEVFSYEPEDENFSLLLKNCSRFKQINPVHSAVVGNGDKQRTFYLNVGKNKGSHSLYIKRKRKVVVVNCLNFQDEINHIKPHILKIDAEGAEYELINSIISLPETVNCIVIELHFGKKEWREKSAQGLLLKINALGFRLINKPAIGGKHWHTIAKFKR